MYIIYLLLQRPFETLKKGFGDESHGIWKILEWGEKGNFHSPLGPCIFWVFYIRVMGLLGRIGFYHHKLRTSFLMPTQYLLMEACHFHELPILFPSKSHLRKFLSTDNLCCCFQNKINFVCHIFFEVLKTSPRDFGAILGL